MAEEAVAAATPRLEMRGIRKAFGATVALDGVDLAVAGGEVCALVGQNGAGKSTLMGILSGALPPDAGSMTLDGAPFRPAQPARRPPRRRRDDLPGAVARAAPVGRGEHPARHGAGAARAAAPRRDAAHRPRRPHARSDIPRSHVDAPAGTLSVAGQQLVEIAPRPRRRLPRARPRRADQQPVAGRRAAAVRPDRRLKRHRARRSSTSRTSSRR